MRTGVAGTLESNDVIMTVMSSDHLSISIKSIVDAFYHDQIDRVIRETLKEVNVSQIAVVCEDKGALDFTIRARLLTAIARMEAQND